MSISRCAAVLFAGVAGLALVGCGGKNDGRVEVAGTVKFKGQPLKEGIVAFEPLGSQGTGANASISGGNYKIARESGLKPGKYLIRISAGDGKTPTNPVNPDEPPGPTGGKNFMAREILPQDWNTKSKQEREVTGENPNKIDFDIP